MSYKIDPVRQSIAESVPSSMDCSKAEQDWHWKAEYGLEKMVKSMLATLSKEKSINKSAKT